MSLEGRNNAIAKCERRRLVLFRVNVERAEREQKFAATDRIDHVLLMKENTAATFVLRRQADVSPSVLNRHRVAFTRDDPLPVQLAKCTRDAIVDRRFTPSCLAPLLFFDEQIRVRAKSSEELRAVIGEVFEPIARASIDRVDKLARVCRACADLDLPARKKIANVFFARNRKSPLPAKRGDRHVVAPLAAPHCVQSGVNARAKNRGADFLAERCE
jgi:hypothetical protein